MTTITKGIQGNYGAWTTKNPDDVKLATRPELVDRYISLVDFAVDFFLHFDTEKFGKHGPQDHEEALIFSVTKLMLNDLQWYLDSGGQQQQVWSSNGRYFFLVSKFFPLSATGYLALSPSLRYEDTVVKMLNLVIRKMNMLGVCF